MCGIFVVRRMEVSCLAGRDQGTGRLPILRTQTWISNELYLLCHVPYMGLCKL